MSTWLRSWKSFFYILYIAVNKFREGYLNKYHNYETLFEISQESEMFAICLLLLFFILQIHVFFYKHNIYKYIEPDFW